MGSIKRWCAAAILMLMAGTAAGGVETGTAATNEVLKKLQENFVDLPVSDFGPGPFAGVYEFVSGDTMLYYFPEYDLLLAGEFFTREGLSLTNERLSAIQKAKQKELPLDLALKIGDGPKRILEFTDPECPFCQSFHQYISSHSDEVTRYVFLYPLRNIHPTAAAKAVHILCAADKQQAFHDIYERKIGMMDLKECDEGKELLAKHEAAGRKVGLTSTPTLILGEGELVRGFDKDRIEKFLSGK